MTKTAVLVRSLLASGIALVAIPLPATGAEPDLSILLRRAGEYVRSYHETLTTIVADEMYVQRATRLNEDEQERTLKSEFALVRGAPGEDLWLAIRDVVEVDGKRIAEQSRLHALLTGARGSLRAAALAIATEQASTTSVTSFARSTSLPCRWSFCCPIAGHDFASHERERWRYREAARAR